MVKGGPEPDGPVRSLVAGHIGSCRTNLYACMDNMAQSYCIVSPKKIIDFLFQSQTFQIIDLLIKQASTKTWEELPAKLTGEKLNRPGSCAASAMELWVPRPPFQRVHAPGVDKNLMSLLYSQRRCNVTESQAIKFLPFLLLNRSSVIGDTCRCRFELSTEPPYGRRNRDGGGGVPTPCELVQLNVL